MEESDFSRVIVSSVKDLGGFAFKMPDPSYQEIMRGAPKRPYDLYYVLGGITVHVEAKFLKGYQAFSLKRVEDHQYENLLSVSKNTEPLNAIVAIAIWEPRRTYDAFFFTIDLLNELRLKMKSINKKTMLALKDAGRALEIKKNALDVSKIRDLTISRSEEIPWL
jgi:penicillin-binding protein-related factor A (putative recombinase)